MTKKHLRYLIAPFAAFCFVVPGFARADIPWGQINSKAEAAADQVCANWDAVIAAARQNYQNAENAAKQASAGCGDCRNENLWREQYSNRKCYTVQNQNSDVCKGILAKIQAGQSLKPVFDAATAAFNQIDTFRTQKYQCRAAARQSVLAREYAKAKAAEEAKKLAEKKAQEDAERRHNEIKKRYEKKKKPPKKKVVKKAHPQKNKEKWTDAQKDAAAKAAAINIINMALGLAEANSKKKKHKKRAAPRRSGH